ncbi:SAF domain-containing protein [Aeromicrobium sp. Leaf350]|uniref:SAF domain-containing protein n=1 Tax=Aeromicrobium sp. Leaf350 TaxID=2876565 RepID=UPI001E3FEDCC|nr:SAF domain-containing protein [Aeromicrobium sp. Leaf350]
MDRLDRLVFAHRRLLAAVCAGLAVLLVTASFQQDGDSREAVVVRDDLDAGTVLTAEHLDTVDLPRAAVPDGALTVVSAAVGRPLAGPVRAGEVVTDRRVVDARDLVGFGVDDPALVTVRVADPAVVGGLRVGDRVDVVAIDPAGELSPSVVARGAVVATLPAATRLDEAGDAVGLVAAGEIATTLAAAGLEAGLTLIAR